MNTVSQTGTPVSGLFRRLAGSMLRHAFFGLLLATVSLCARTAMADPFEILSDPQITSHPSDATICSGQNTVFSVSATGSSLTYQWQTDSGTGTFTDIVNGGVYSGAATASLTITGATTGIHTWRYRCMINGTLASYPARLSVNSPVIDVSVAGFTASAEVAGASWPLSYAWASHSSVADRATYPQAGSYAVSVTDAAGCTATKPFVIGCDIQVNTTKPTCSGDENGTATVVINGAMVTGLPDAGGGDCLVPEVSAYSCSTGCTPYSANTGEVNVGSGQTVCLTATDFRGTLVLSGGTLIVCGKATATEVRFTNSNAPVSLIINGELVVDADLNPKNACIIKNYGKLRIEGNANAGWQFENHGEMDVRVFNVNKEGQFSNTGDMLVRGDFNNYNHLVNGGKIRILGSLDNNSGSGFENLCELHVVNRLLNNTLLVNKGTVTVGDLTFLNGGSRYQADAGSRFTTEYLMANGDMTGLGASCASMRVRGETRFNGTSRLSGHIDLCAESGFAHAGGQVIAPATTDCSCAGGGSEEEEPLSSGFYTWGTGIEATGPQAGGLAAGSYTVEVSVPGCSTVNKPFSIVNPVPVSIVMHIDGHTATAEVSGGSRPYFYFWTAATGTDSLQNYEQEGNYTLHVTDSKGCSATADFTIGEEKPCDFTVVTTDPLCAGGEGTATVLRNGEILTTGTTLGGNTSLSCSVPQTTTESCLSGCDAYSSNTGVIDLRSGDRVCLTASAFTGTINIRGGTLIVCGEATPSQINIQDANEYFTLIVNGTFTWPDFNFTSLTTVRNYGTIHIPGSCGFNGQLENHGRVTVEGDFSINQPAGRFLNYNYFATTASFNNINTTINGGTMVTDIDFKINGLSDLVNSCRIFVGGELHNNTSLVNRGSIVVEKRTVMNDTSRYEGDAGSLLSTRHLMANGRMEGVGASCAMVRVDDQTTLNGSSILAGKLDLCDANGVNTADGLVLSPATTNCSCQGPVEWNPPLEGGENPYKGLLPGSYTVQIDVPGCPATSLNFEINEPDPVLVSVTLTALKAEAEAEGGSGTYRYTWSDGAEGTDPVHVFATGGEHWVAVTDGRGCVVTSYFTLIPPGQCTGECDHVQVDYTSDGRFAISCDCPGECLIRDADNVSLEAGMNYSRPGCDSRYIVITPDGCAVEMTVQGLDETCEETPLRVNYKASPRSSCEANGVVALTIESGSGHYSIYNNANSQRDATIISGLDAGTVQVTVIDNISGLSKTLDIAVGIVDAGSIGMEVVSTGVGGLPATVRVNIVPASVFSATDYKVQWSTGASGHGPVTLGTADYKRGVVHATIIDPAGCPLTRSLTLAEDCSGASFIPDFDKTPPTCYGRKDGAIALTNRPSGTSIYWSETPGLSTGDILSGIGKGDYRLIVTGTTLEEETCILYNEMVSLGEPAELKVSIAGSGPEYTATATGGTTPVMYTWSVGARDQSVLLEMPGLYRVTARDANECVATAYKRVIWNCPGTFELNPVAPACPGGSDGVLSATFSVSGLDYFWTGKDISNPAASTVSGLSAGDYMISVRDPLSGCVSYAGISLRDPGPMVIAHRMINDSTAMIVVENRLPGAWQVRWTDNDFVGNIRQNLENATEYTVEITDSKGCVQLYTFRFDYTCDEQPIQASRLIDDRTVTVTASGGIGTLSYDWGNGTSGATAEHIYTSAGIYSIIVSDERLCARVLDVHIGEEGCSSGDCAQIDVVYLPGNQFKIVCACPDGCQVLDELEEPTAEETVFDRPATGKLYKVLTPGGCIEQVFIPGRTGELPTITATPVHATCASAGSVSLVITNGSGDYYITNSSNAQTNNTTITNLPVGTTRVTVHDRQRNQTAFEDIEILRIEPTRAVFEVLTRAGAGNIPKFVQLNPLPPSGHTTSPYTISWSTGHTGTGPHTLSDDIVYAGFVSATITDANNCQYIALLDVQECTESFTPQWSHTQPSCHGGANGQIALLNLPSGASMMWEGATWYQNSATAVSLRADTYKYQITKTGSNGQRCVMASGTTSLGQPDRLAVTISSSGQVYTASAAGGTPSYTYQWYNQPSGPSVTLSAEGTYSVEVTDSKGCPAGGGVIVTPPLCSGTVSLLPQAPSCPGVKDGSLEASHATPGVQYAWTGPDVVTASDRIQLNLGAGLYTVHVTDASSNCVLGAGLLLSDPLPMVVSHQISGRTVTIVVSNGKPEHKVQWSDRAGFASSRDDLQTGLTYTVTVYDAGNCPKSYTFLYEDPCLDDPLSATVALSEKTATVTATGGQGAYRYAWSDGITTTENEHRFLNAGNHSVIVRDARGCAKTLPVVIAGEISCKGDCESVDVTYYENETFRIGCDCPGDCEVTGPDDQPLEANIPAPLPENDAVYRVLTPDGCIIRVTVNGRESRESGWKVLYDQEPASVCKKDGSIRLRITNGSGDYQIANSANGQTDALHITGLPAGRVTVTILDRVKGFYESLDIDIPSRGTGKVTIEALEHDAQGNVSVVQAIITPAARYTAEQYTLSWSAGLSGPGPHAVPVSAYQDGKLSVLARDPAGCPADTSLPLVPACQESFVPDIASALPGCADSRDGSLELLNQPANTSVSWTGHGRSSSSALLDGIGRGSYQLILIRQLPGGGRCTLHDGEASLSAPAPLVPDYTRLGSLYTASASGGTAPYAWQWSGQPAGASATLTEPGLYTLSVTDANDCPASLPVQVIRPCEGTLTARPVHPACPGTATGTLEGIFSGTGIVHWTAMSGTVQHPDQPLISGLKADTYYLSVRDEEENCVSFISVELLDPAPMRVSHQYNGEGAVRIAVEGGQPDYSVRWTEDDVLAQSRTDLEPGRFYTVEITDAILCKQHYTFYYEGCASAPIQLYVLVEGDHARPVLSGGTGAYTYAWKALDGGTVNASEAEQSDLDNGSYTLVVTDERGCEAEATIHVPDCDLTVLPVVISDPTCSGACDGSARLQGLENLPAGSRIYWNDRPYPELTGGCTGTHTVRVITAENCAVERRVELEAPANAVCPEVVCTRPFTLTAPGTESLRTNCYGVLDQVDIALEGGTAPFTYTWTVPGINGVGTETYISENRDLSNAMAGSYELEVIDAEGCDGTVSFEIYGPSATLSASYTLMAAPCVGHEGAVTILPTGGVSPYTVQWPDESTGTYRDDLLPDFYELVIEDAMGCPYELVVEVPAPVGPRIDITASRRSLCPGDHATLHARQVAGYSHVWSGPGVISPQSLSLRTTEPGVYVATYTADLGGCVSLSDTLEIFEGTSCGQVSIVCKPVVIEYDADPAESCLSQQKIAAEAHAMYRYRKYVEEQRRVFKRNYVRQVMGTADETLTMRYSDSEGHYTLYYYDQAGNLVQTVPPAGVVPLSSGAVTTAITDLNSNSRTTLTAHTLATAYAYNSLNQLVSQDMPDHEQMALWEHQSSELSDLSDDAHISALAYGSPLRGILLSDNGHSAGLHMTADGGATWTSVSNPGASTIRALTEAGGKGYAVGDKGTFLRRDDAESDWRVRTGPTGGDLTGVYFDALGHGLVTGRDGTVWASEDGGDTWSAARSGLGVLAAGYAIASVHIEGNTLWATGTREGRGAVWNSTNGGASWQAYGDFAAGALAALTEGSSASTVLAGGADGRLFEINAFGDIRVRRTNLDQPIQVLAKSGGRTVAIAGAASRLYASDAAGTQWSELNTQEDLSQLLEADTRLVAVTADGRTAETLTGTFAAPAVTMSGFERLRHVQGSVLSGANQSGYVVMVADPVLYKASNESFDNGSNWTAVTISNLPGGTTVRDVLVASPGIWALLLSNGTVVKAEEDGTNSLAVSGSALATGVHSLYPVDAGACLLLTTGGFSYLDSDLDLTTSILPSLSVGASSVTDLRLRMNTGNTEATVIVNGADVYQLDNNQWVARHLIPSGLKAVHPAGSDVWAAGANGELYKKTSASPAWVYQPHGEPNMDISLLASDATGTLYAASGGGIYTYEGGVMSRVASLNATVSALHMEGAAGLASTISGGLYAKEVLSSDWVRVLTAESGLYALQPALAGGDEGALYGIAGTEWAALAGVQIPSLAAVVFGDVNSAVAVGTNGTILTSPDAGLSWTTRHSGTTADLTAVTAYSNSIALAGGKAGTLRYSGDGGQNWHGVSLPGSYASSDIEAVRTANGSRTLILAGDGLFRYTMGGSAPQQESVSLGATGRGLWLDKDSYGFIVGDGGLAIRISPSGGGNYSYERIATDSDGQDEKGTGIPVADLKTVFFTDRMTGYITGANGLVLKSTDGGYHWKTRSAGGTGVPLLAMASGERGTLIDGAGQATGLRDRADAMGSRFWYDELGRLVLSQNAKQHGIEKHLSEEEKASVEGDGVIRAYSYTLYDKIGRIREVGEVLLRSEPQTHKYESQVRYSYVESTFITGGTTREITRTYYDKAQYNHILKDFRQENLRPRVATATYQDKAGEGYDRATHYSYDVHGNVKSLVQEVKAHGTGLKKRVDYAYDLVSGKVNYVYYQRGEVDQFIHRYEYDGDNRIVRVYTSRNGQVWEEDATYEYYGHGPLARTTLGEQKVETQDYVYTLQGWIKGVKGHEFSYALGYYESDYQSIGTSSNLATPVAKNLYNGNIATMATHTPAQGTKNPAHAWQTQQFGYDQLNRIKESRTLGGHENAYRTGYGYDANGNILSLSRYDGSGAKQFDQLTYRYENKANGYGRNTNRLRWVDDGTSITEDFEDIKDQDTDNYEYDAIGNLVRDEQEEIDRIEWTVYGKVKAVHRKSGSEKPYLEFGYDAGGNRISKLSRDKDGYEKVTLYVRDASGNVMAIYEKTPERALAVTEHHVYGSSRLGIVRTNSASDLATLHSGRVLGLKDFELSDHLGNVRVVLKDVRNSVGLTEVSGAYDYYAFGMLMPGRKVDNGATRYGYGGQEMDNEITGVSGTHYTAEYWMYDARLGRRWNLDPVCKEHESPYAAFANNPVWFMDPTGADTIRDKNGNLTWNVEKGDTYSSIASTLLKYGIEEIDITNDLKEWNTQKAENLKIGSTLSLFPTDPNGLPVHFVYASGPKATEVIFSFTVKALATNPDWAVLTYLGKNHPQANQNRKIATDPCSGARVKGVIEIDEFPYASTFEGGYDAMCLPVPSREQRRQGGQLSVLYRKLGPGAKFLVIPVPGEPQPQPQPIGVPIPVLAPSGKGREINPYVSPEVVIPVTIGGGALIILDRILGRVLAPIAPVFFTPIINSGYNGVENIENEIY